MLAACLEGLFHTELLATLCRAKPLSIIRAFSGDPRARDVWGEAWSSGLLNNSDLIWRIVEHESGPALWVGSAAALVPHVPKRRGNLWERIDLVSSNIPTEPERSRFFGKLFGYPASQVEWYAGRSPAERRRDGTRVPLYPASFAPPISGSFLAGDPEHPEVMDLLARLERAVARFEQLIREGGALVSILNEWSLFV